MNELKQQVIDYWLKSYKAKRWPFIQRLMIAKALGRNINIALRELAKEKKVILKRSINDVLVVYVGDKQILNEFKHYIN
ncbi:MAG: hypothetical protein ACOXZV_00705 [Bacteroidales bacterium]|jgi:L-cystine uptake protein TcyP (sodium:dicarboxylate symporter family)